MIIDTAMIAVLVTVILALLTFSAWVGALHQKVKSNREASHAETTSNREYISSVSKDFKDFQKENKIEHTAIVAKLDMIIMNGKKGN